MKNFIKQHKAHLILLLTLLTISVVSSLLLVFDKENTRNRELRIENYEINSSLPTNKQELMPQNDESENAQTTDADEIVPPSATSHHNHDTEILKPSTTTDNQVQDDPSTISPLSSGSDYGTSNDKKESYDLSLRSYNLFVNDNEYSLNLPPDHEHTVYSLMQALTADSNPASAEASVGEKKPFAFTSKEYAGLGHFVESINGIKNNPQENKYWIYYINGQSAPVGISQYVLKKGDVIEWKFENSKF